MKKPQLWIGTALSLSLAIACEPAFAQEAGPGAQEAGSGAQNRDATPGDSEAVPDEIVVTAQKRTQVLIDVPQSVTVVGGETLERQQATSFQDYLKLVPGLQLDQSTPGVGRLVLRGINTGGVAATVAVYVDETQFGSSSGLVNGAILAGDFDTFDIARIEVLRGPQGTLYGASSLGGVLKFVTNEPKTDRIAARARGSVETTKGGDLGYSGTAMLNLPISDTLAVRGSGYYRKIGGFVDSIGTGGSDVDKNINDTRSYGGRVSALFRPSDAFSLRLSAYLQNLATDASSVVESDPDTLLTLYGRLSQSQFVPTFTDVKYRVYNGTLDYDFGFASLTSATSYSTLDQTFRIDLTTQFSPLLVAALGFPANELLQNQQTDVRKFTQELRLASPSNDRFEWLVGGYYTREKGLIDQGLVAVAPGTLTPLTGLPQIADVTLASLYKEYAGFANATVHFGERFDLTFGGRYSYNRQRAQQNGAGVLGGGNLPVSRSSEDVITYSVAPKFKLGRNASLYARVAKGFRPGGPNILPPAAPADTPRTYQSDSVLSYEVGFKAETADRRLGIDVSAFYIDWKDIQLFAVINNFGVNANGGKAKSSGVEFTLTTRPLRGLNVSLNGAYTIAKLTDDTPAIVGGFDGDRLPFNPEASVGINADYEWTLAGETTAFLGASFRGVSKQNGDFDLAYRSANGRQRQVRAYDVVDLRAGVDLGAFSVEAFAKNVTDSHGRTSTGGIGGFPNGALPTGVIRPRSFGVTVGAGF